MPSPIIAVQNLTKRFGDKTAVDDLSFSVEPGTLFAFLGQNGAGKSTTINMALGLLRPDSGEIRFGITEDEGNYRSKVGAVFQNNVLDNVLSVEENLKLYGQLYLPDKAAVRRRYDEVAERLNLTRFHKTRFGRCSGGEKRKAEIARALFTSPQLLFLDEPTTGLDPRTRAEVWQLLHDIRREGGLTVFLTTHYMEETADADKVVIIHKGKKAAEGSPAELKAQYSQDRLLLTPEDPQALEQALTTRGLSYEITADTYAVAMESTAESIELLYALRSNLRYYEAVKGSMDDVFLNAVGEQIGGKDE
ncbi:MAG: ABC transporter ATP-binding protein [Oscillospiraceae bacterium]|nr:ABC transporter ATP-binding protein [Oscillospiraceae bacterium]